MKQASGLKEFLKELFRRFNDDQVPQVGAQLAYYLLLSLFPLLIFVLSLLSFTPLAQTDSLTRLLSALPRETADMIQPIVIDIVQSRSGSILGLSLFLSLWSGSNGINNLIRSMDSAYDIENTRKMWLRRVIAVGYTILLAVVIVLALVIQVFGNQIMSALVDFVPSLEFIYSIWQILQLFLPLIIIILSLAGLYKWGPGFPKDHSITFGEALVGAAVAGVLWSLASFGFGFYVNNFANYSNTYGSLGGVIILILWLFLTSIIIMLGAEVSATYVSRIKGGLTWQSQETLDQEPDEVPVAAMPLVSDKATDLTVRPMRLELVTKPKQKPLHKKPAFYLGSALGGGLVWLVRSIAQRIRQ